LNIALKFSPDSLLPLLVYTISFSSTTPSIIQPLTISMIPMTQILMNMMLSFGYTVDLEKLGQEMAVTIMSAPCMTTSHNACGMTTKVYLQAAKTWIAMVRMIMMTILTVVPTHCNSPFVHIHQ